MQSWALALSLFKIKVDCLVDCRLYTATFVSSSRLWGDPLCRALDSRTLAAMWQAFTCRNFKCAQLHHNLLRTFGAILQVGFSSELSERKAR
jgi:hypothetical protein